MRLCIHGCGRELRPNARLEECRQCRSGYYYWNKKPPEARIARRSQLDVLSSRLDTHFDVGGALNNKLQLQPKPRMTRGKLVVVRERRRVAP